VSDFLSRLAARAVREPSRALPGSPSATEAAAPSRDVTPSTANEPPLAHATPSAPAVRSEAPESRIESQQAPLERPATGTPPERIVERSVVHAAAPPAPTATAEPSVPEVAPARSVPIAAAAPVVAAPIVRRVVESRLERLRTVSTTVAADERPVRVRIGRLEVRANLEQPASRPERREPQKQQRTTLSDYLRGKGPA
jgi:hypothetical protein